MKIVRYTEVERQAVKVEGAEGVHIRWLISKKDGAENIAMRMFELEPGGLTPLHTHPHEHEVFIVEGRGVFVCGEREYEFDSGYVIFVPGGTRHRFRNTGESVLKFLCIIPASAT